MTTGVIIINNMELCVGFRGELAEKDAIPIADLIARATGSAEEYKGQINYRQKTATPPPTPSPTSPLTPVAPDGLSPNSRSPASAASALASVSPNVGSLLSRESVATLKAGPEPTMP
ncbi:hypothetical protein FRB97_000545 [Tulasnella sp. 331]|nr:hypothetical protein FRB97_000545 [Tulasnella sp. 331]